MYASFNNRQYGPCWNNLRQLETRSLIKLAELLFHAFPPLGQRHHQDVHDLTGMRFVARGENCIDNENASLLVHRFAAAAQDFQTSLIALVVENPLENVDVSSLWQGLEKIPTGDLTAIH
jgi:hypothetical protein